MMKYFVLFNDFKSHVYPISFSYENGMEIFRFGLPSTLSGFIIRHQMKTIENGA